MKIFVFTKLGRAAVLAAVLAVAAASAGEALFYTPVGVGLGDAARLGYGGGVFKQRSDDVADAAPGSDAAPDFYFALKVFDIANHNTLGLGGDFMFIMPGGIYQGADIGIGVGIPVRMSGDTLNLKYDFGVGYNFGKELCLPGNFQVLLGGSVGLWMGMSMEQDNKKELLDMYYNIVGPSVRFHWHSVELMYRMLLGFSLNYDISASSFEIKTGFGTTQRISLGYCFGKNPK